MVFNFEKKQNKHVSLEQNQKYLTLLQLVLIVKYLLPSSAVTKNYKQRPKVSAWVSLWGKSLEITYFWLQHRKPTLIYIIAFLLIYSPLSIQPFKGFGHTLKLIDWNTVQTYDWLFPYGFSLFYKRKLTNKWTGGSIRKVYIGWIFCFVKYLLTDLFYRVIWEQWHTLEWCLLKEKYFGWQALTLYNPIVILLHLKGIDLKIQGNVSHFLRFRHRDEMPPP